MTLPVPRVVIVKEGISTVIAEEITPDTVSVSTPGTAGPAGPAGPPGAPGGSRYEHIQASPSTTWTVTHNLGYIPGAISVYIDDDLVSDGVDIDLDVTFPTMILYINVNIAQAGRVSVS